MPNHWAIKDYEQEVTASGVKITAITWQPCHLWLRWSLIPPKEHIIPAYLRGIFLHADKYFCFDVYTDNQQEEAGDTLEHTFIKEPWPVCETRYFYFHGTIDGKSSSSTSAIFNYHRTYVPPPQEFIAYLHEESGWLRKYNTDWEEIRTAPIGGGFTNPTTCYIRSRVGAAGNFYIRRTVFRFDTTDLPPGADIQSATLHFYVVDRYGYGDPDTYLVSGQGLGPLMFPEDYGTLLPHADPVADIIPWANLIEGEYTQTTLNQLGLDLIIPGGISYYGIRSAPDADDVPPVYHVLDHRLAIRGPAEPVNRTYLKIQYLT